MRWIVSASKEVYVDKKQLQARHNYIREVTNAEVTKWEKLQIRGTEVMFFNCFSDDDLKGTSVTAHIGDALRICSLYRIANSDFVIVNSCIWNGRSDNRILQDMRKINGNVDLWFSKQELSLEGGYMLRQCVTLNNIGNFGFHTSLSERQLYVKRHKGFMSAVQESYSKVSPIVLL